MSKLTNDSKQRFFPYIGEFPLETNFEPNFFDAIHISNVLHFIRGEYFDLSLQKCFSWLKPEGKIFINTCSLYFPYFRDFVKVYENRKNNRQKWPGEIENYKYFMPQDAPRIQIESEPDFLHVFKRGDLESKLKAAGFTICTSEYFTLKNLDFIKYADDSRSWIGIIANKKP